MSRHTASRSNSASPFAATHAVSTSARRSSGRTVAVRNERATGFSRFAAVRSGLELLWDLSLIDRLQTAPLTHYHE